MKYKLGILGGMSPSATCSMYQRIIDHTVASCDQEHIKMVILNDCDTPDRTKALLENGENPLPYLNKGIETLIGLGCEYFVIPCNTAHAYADHFLMQDRIKFISMITEVEKELETKYSNKRICVLCTWGTRNTKIYENNNLSIFYPTNQQKVMDVITNTKAGISGLDALQEVVDEEKDYDIFLLACTELSLYKDLLKTDKIIIDAMDVLVRATIESCGKQYK